MMQLRTMRSEAALKRELGQYISLRRTLSGFTQIEVSRRLKFSAQFYGKIEKGDVGCPLESLLILIPLINLEKSKVRKVFVRGAKNRADELFELVKKGRART